MVAARLTHTLCEGEPGNWSPQLWQDTRLAWNMEPAALRRWRRWRDVLTGATLEVPADEGAGLDLVQLFAQAQGLPFAVLVAEEPAP